jgi:hypothetical protein
MRRIFTALALGAALFGAPAAQAATLTTDPAALALFTAAPEGARFRSQTGGEEIYVGTGGLGTGANRSAAQYNWALSQPFTVIYNAVTGAISASLGSGATQATATRATAAGQDFNALRIAVTGPNDNGGPQGGTYMTMTGVSVNGEAAGNILGAVSGARVTLGWLLSDFAALPGGVTLTGTLNYFGPIGRNISAESARIDVTFGNVPTPAPIPLPAAGWLLLAGLGALGAMARRGHRAA